METNRYHITTARGKGIQVARELQGATGIAAQSIFTNFDGYSDLVRVDCTADQWATIEAEWAAHQYIKMLD